MRYKANENTFTDGRKPVFLRRSRLDGITSKLFLTVLTAQGQVLTVGLGALRSGSQYAFIAAQRRMLVSLEIPSKDRSYEWFLSWMAYQTSARAALQQSRWARMHQLSVETYTETRPNGSVNAFFTLVAGPGTHWFQYNGIWMQVIVQLSFIRDLTTSLLRFR
jgi:hypothetical protein